jgi:tricorn protease
MKNLLLFALLLAASTIQAQNAPQWMRYPVISPDGKTIVFTYKGDLYKVSAEGGDAVQLTYHDAHDYMPVWSPDGSQIAFASDRYGNFDIFVMPSQGGAATRLTFHSNDEQPYSFSPDGKSVYFGALRQDAVLHRQHPHRSQPELYAVPVKTGRVEQILTIPAEYISFNKKGNQFLYHDKKGGENEWRKHHQSAICRDIWLYDEKSNQHTQITSFKGEDRQPIWAEDGKSFFYLSEESGTFQVHQMNLEDKKSTQLTKFKLHPVRFLSRGKNTLCFGFDGEIYTMEIGKKAKKVKINIRTQNKGNNDKFISINGGIQEMAISPNGKEIAFIARGEVFVTAVDASFTKRLTNTPERERFVKWGPEGKSVIYSSERNGKWSVFKTEKVRKEEPFFFAATLIKEEALIDNKKDNYLAEYSPDGKQIAFIEDRRTLKVLDLESKKEVTLLTPEDLFHMSDGDKYFSWSPDSKWLLVDWGKSLSNSEILLMATDGSKRINLTESGYYDAGPKWVNGGKQMLWFSNRDGLKSYATSGRSQMDVYSMFFSQEAWDDFNLTEEEFKLKKAIEEALKKEAEEKKKKEAAAKKEKEGDDKKEEEQKEDKDKKEEKDSSKVEPLVFDWKNMTERKKRLTIHSSSLGDAVLSKKGDKLYYLARFEGKMNLWETNLRTKETKMLIKLGATSGNLEWDAERKQLFLLSSGKISIVEVEKKKTKVVKIKGEMEFDADAERQAIFDHVWLRTQKIFYHSNFHGVDWDLMKKEYQKYVPHIGNPYEMTEMLSEMLGELNVSHAGAGYRGGKMANADATASLGVIMNWDYDQDGILIDEILEGGPLDKAKFKLEKGMIIQKIDGIEIKKDQDLAKYLNRKAGEFTLLEILDPKGDSSISLTMKPISLGEESRLLYKRWVKQNEIEVREKTDGQLGYVHIPGMSDGPYRSIYQDMMGKYFECKGVIVDTRFNGGGDLVADLAMFFTGQPFISYETEAKVVGGEPTSRWTKPTLALIGEAQYSDGHCFACGYSDLKIGKTVGMPVPGTCSFAGWEGLPDGSYWGVVPVSAKDINGDWMENNETAPQFEVKNMPAVVDQGRDQQLEKAIEELLKDVR